MNRDYPWFPFFPKDWLNDSQLSMASLSSQGIWTRFLCVAYHAPEPGRLAGTQERLMRVIGCSREEFAAFLQEARELRFADIRDLNPGTIEIISRRMQRDDLIRRQARENNAERKRRQRGRDIKGEAAVTHGVTHDVTQSVTTDTAGDPNPNSDADSNTDPKAESESERPPPEGMAVPRRKRRMAPLPEDFGLDAELRIYADAKGVAPDLELEKFRAHYLSTDQVRKDWRRAFQSWVLRAVEFRSDDRSRDPAGMIAARMKKSGGVGV